MGRTNKTGINWDGPTAGNLLRKTYNSWRNMRERCKSDSDQYYPYYKKKGIKVCPEWDAEFLEFLGDLGECPDVTYSLDRIDNDKDYCKENCRWASPLLQALNRDYGEDQGLYQKESGKWTARMKFGGKYVTLGTHEDKEIAMMLRRAAELVVERLIEIEVLK